MARTPRTRFRFETLEDRSVPAVHTWIGAGLTDNWSDPDNWVGFQPPTTGEPGGTIVVLGVADTPVQDIPDLVIDQLQFTSNGTVSLFVNNPLTINGGSAFDLDSVSGTNTISGGLLTLATAATGITVESGSTLNISLAVQGTPAVQKNGSGTLTLSSNANSFTGDLTVAAGTLVATSGGSGANPVTSTLGNPQTANRIISVNAGATLLFAGSNVLGNNSSTPAVGLNIAGTVTNSGNLTNVLGPVTMSGGTLRSSGGLDPDYQAWNLRGESVTVTGSQPSSFQSPTAEGGFHLGANTTFNVANVTNNTATDLIVSGVLRNQSNDQSNAAANVVFTGLGTTALNGANTYTGATSVASGELLVNGSITSPVSVSPDAVLGGRGTVNGTVTASPFGIVAPGDAAAVGTLATGALTLQPLSFFEVRVNGAGAGQFDSLNVTGAVIVDGSTLLIPDTGPVLTSGSIIIIENDDTDGVIGTFAGIAEGGTVTADDGRTFTVSYTAGDGNDVALIAIATPTPPTAMLTAAPPMIDITNNSNITTFTVQYSDNVAVDGSTLGADIDVIAPNGTTVIGTATAATQANGSPLTVVYTLTRLQPWVPTERGTYTLRLRSNAVNDTAGTPAAATDLGTFVVCVREILPSILLASGSTGPGGATSSFGAGPLFNPLAKTFSIGTQNQYGAAADIALGLQVNGTEFEAHVATGDVNGDGTPDFVAGIAFGSSQVRVISGADRSTVLADFQAIPGHQFGVYVAVGDLDGDGKADVAVTADAPNAFSGPMDRGLLVRVFSGASMTGGTSNPTVMANFNGLASLSGAQGEASGTKLGGRVAIGDVNGDGRSDLLVAAGNGGGPRICVWDGPSVGAANGGTPAPPIANLFVFEEQQRGGSFIAAGDVNGDCFVDIIAGGGPGGGPRVRIVDAKKLFNPSFVPNLETVNLDAPANLSNGLVLSNFFAFGDQERGGVRVAAKDIDGDTRADVVAGLGYREEIRASLVPPFLPESVRFPTSSEIKVYRGATFAGTTGEPSGFQSLSLGLNVLDGVFVG